MIDNPCIFRSLSVFLMMIIFDTVFNKSVHLPCLIIEKCLLKKMNGPKDFFNDFVEGWWNYIDSGLINQYFSLCGYRENSFVLSIIVLSDLINWFNKWFQHFFKGKIYHYPIQWLLPSIILIGIYCFKIHIHHSLPQKKRGK